MLLINDQLDYCNCGGGQLEFPCFSWKINCIIITEDELYYWKINSIIGRSIAILKDQCYYWKINCIIGKSIVLEDQWYY